MQTKKKWGKVTREEKEIEQVGNKNGRCYKIIKTSKCQAKQVHTYQK